MAVEWKLFAAGAVFFAAVTLLYGLTSHEEAGTAMLGLAAPALALVALYVFALGRGTGPRPEDRTDADPGDGAGDVGYFPSSSTWPLVLAWAAVMIANAFVFGVWLAITGGLLFVAAVVGYALEAQAKA
jgi:hypothetical protein